MSDLITDALQNSLECHIDQLEYELKAAWRMGYDYVHVYDEPSTTKLQPLNEITISQHLHPTDQRTPAYPDSLGYRYTYDLTSASDVEIRSKIYANNE